MFQRKPTRRFHRSALVAVTVFATVSALASVAGATVATDKADYSPGSVVTISGNNDNRAGYVEGHTVDVAAAADNALWHDGCSATVSAGGAWSCTVTLSDDPAIAVGNYTYTATSTDAEGNQISESGTFTDGNVAAATVSTYTYAAGSCTSTGASTFALGDTICAKANVTDISGGSATLYFVWYKGAVAQHSDGVSVAATGVVSQTYAPSLAGTDWSVKVCAQSDCAPAEKLLDSATFTVAAGPSPVIAWTAHPSSVDESATAARTYTFFITDADSSAWTFVTGHPSCGTNGTLVDSSDTITGSTGTFQCTFPDGPKNSTVSATVHDGTNESNELTQVVAISNVAPTVTAFAGNLTVSGCRVTISSVTFTDPANSHDDPYSGVVDWGYLVGTGDQESLGTANYGTSSGSFTSFHHDYAGPGSYIVGVSVTDKDEETGSNTATASVAAATYQGTLPPVSLGAKQFKVGSTIPVKVTVTGCPDTEPPTLSITGPSGPVHLEDAGAANQNSDYMRYDASLPGYIYNWKTVDGESGVLLEPGSYTITVANLLGFVNAEHVTLSLKKK